MKSHLKELWPIVKGLIELWNGQLKDLSLLQGWKYAVEGTLPFSLEKRKKKMLLWSLPDHQGSWEWILFWIISGYQHLKGYSFSSERSSSETPLCTGCDLWEVTASQVQNINKSIDLLQARNLHCRYQGDFLLLLFTEWHMLMHMCSNHQVTESTKIHENLSLNWGKRHMHRSNYSNAQSSQESRAGLSGGEWIWLFISMKLLNCSEKLPITLTGNTIVPYDSFLMSEHKAMTDVTMYTKNTLAWSISLFDSLKARIDPALADQVHSVWRSGHANGAAAHHLGWCSDPSKPSLQRSWQDAAEGQITEAGWGPSGRSGVIGGGEAAKVGLLPFILAKIHLQFPIPE